LSSGERSEHVTKSKELSKRCLPFLKVMITENEARLCKKRRERDSNTEQD